MNDSPEVLPQRQSFFDRIRGAMVLMLIVLGGFILYYSLFFERKMTYFRGRNARLIDLLGSEIRRSINDTGRIVEVASNLPEKELHVYKRQRGRSMPQAIFDDIQLLSPDEAPQANHDFAERRGASLRITFERAGDGRSSERETTLKKLLEPEEKPSGTAKPAKPKKVYARATISLWRLLNTMVQQSATGVFDTVFILDRSGNVIYQWTPHSGDDSDAELKIVRLKELQSPRLFEKETTLQSSELMSASRQMAVRIGDRSYQLFSVPLRSGLHLEDEAHGHKEAAAKPDAKPGDGIPDDTWAVCGAVASGEFRSRSLAISATLLSIVGAVVLLMIFSWPFLKMGLSSPQQKITLADVILLGVSGVLATAIVCLILLDAFTYTKLEAIADRQLETFSNLLETNLGAEIFTALIHLDVAQTWIEEALDSGQPVETRSANLLARRGGDTHPFPDMTKPFFQSFSLIGEDGRQKLKSSVERSATPLVNTETRTYFTAPLQRGREYHEIDGRRVAIESVRSLTSGQPEVIFARRTDEGKTARKDQLRERLPVIAMSMPSALSLLEPVIPEGFGFAIIDDTGRVLFHSNSERNTIENFFAETDENTELRSAVTARQMETMNIRYLGDDYAAHIRPMQDLPWTLITFREKNSLRMVNTEALLISLIFMAVLTVASLVTIGLILLLRPRYRAEWLWPDPRRVDAYAELSAAYVFLFAVAAVSLPTLRGSALLIFPFWFVPLTVAITYLYLRPNVRGVRRIVFFTVAAACTTALLVQLWSTEGRAIVPVASASLLLLVVATRAALRREETQLAERVREKQTALPLCYTWAAFLLLLLTSIVPTTAFFKAAYEMEIDSHVKRTQMKLAGDLQNRWWRVNAEFSRERGEGKERFRSWRWKETLDIYAIGIFGTTVDFEPKAGPAPAGIGTPRIPGFIELLLPRYSATEVSTRELVHDRAADNLWWWVRDGARLNLVMKSRTERPFIISSVVPQLLPTMSRIGVADMTASPVAMIALALLAIAIAAFIIARFIARRVFLVDLVQPLSLANGYVGLRHVICHPCDDASARRLFREFRKIDLATQEGLASARTAPQSFDVFEPAVFIDGINHSFAGGERSELLRALLDRLTRNTDRTVVLRPEALTVITRSFLLGPDRQAWAAALGPFVWVNWSQLITTEKRITLSGSTPVFVEESPKKRWSWRSLYTLAGFHTYFEQLTDLRGTIQRTLKSETNGDPYLHTLVTALSGDATSRDQVLDEIGERAEEYYRALWHTCSPDEQLVLMQLAQTGLVNGKTRKHVRRLLARGHLRRDPQLRVMNETFRRFVLAQCATSKLARELEHDLAGDAWSRFRVPFFASVAIVLLFFFMTQRQMFDSTIALVTGLAASLPAFLKMLSGLGERAKAKG